MKHIVFFSDALINRAWCLLELAVSAKSGREIIVIGKCPRLGMNFVKRMKCRVDADKVMIMQEICKQFGDIKTFEQTLQYKFDLFLATSPQVLVKEARKLDHQKVFRLDHRNRWRIVSGDSVQAVKLLLKAVDFGCADAQYLLGFYYYWGLGLLPEDRARAMELWRLAAKQGHIAASNRIN